MITEVFGIPVAVAFTISDLVSLDMMKVLFKLGGN